MLLNLQIAHPSIYPTSGTGSMKTDKKFNLIQWHAIANWGSPKWEKNLNTEEPSKVFYSKRRSIIIELAIALLNGLRTSIRGLPSGRSSALRRTLGQIYQKSSKSSNFGSFKKTCMLVQKVKKCSKMLDFGQLNFFEHFFFNFWPIVRRQDL